MTRSVAVYHCSICAGTDHNARRCPRYPRHVTRPTKVTAEPKCVDCGETDRTKFYAHPTSRTGCQARCKPCDNQKRMGNYRRGSGGGVSVIRRPDGSLEMVRRTTHAIPERSGKGE